MVQRDVAPEHQAAVVRLQHFTHAIEMFEVDRAHAARFRGLAALPFTELKGFVGADVKKFAGEQFIQLAIPVG